MKNKLPKMPLFDTFLKFKCLSVFAKIVDNF